MESKENTITERVGYFLHLSLLTFMLLYAGTSVEFFKDVLSANNDAIILIPLFWHFLIWVILSLVLFYLKTNILNFSSVALMLSVFHLILLPGLIISMLLDITNFSFFEKKYTGIHAIEHEQQGEGNWETLKVKSFIFENGDLRLNHEWEKINSEYEEEPETMEYLFWQAGYASGYNPKFIPTSYEYNLVKYKISFGFFVVLETLNSTLNNTLLIFWIPIGLVFLPRINLSFKSKLNCP